VKKTIAEFGIAGAVWMIVLLRTESQHGTAFYFEFAHEPKRA
jgi:hypothetical protein